jgi:hypothetical protein
MYGNRNLLKMKVVIALYYKEHSGIGSEKENQRANK